MQRALRSDPLAPVVEATGAVEVVTSTSSLGTGVRVEWSVRNPGRRSVRLRRAGLREPSVTAPTTVVEHGWQSWSPVRPCRVGDVLPARSRAPAWRRAMYCADARAAGRVVVTDHLLVHDGGVLGFLDGHEHLGTVVAEAGRPPTAWAILDGVALAPGAERRLEPVWFATGEPGELLRELAAHWAARAGGRSSTTAPASWCSWYRFGASVTPAQVRSQIAPASEHGLDVILVDDGWQATVGDWTSCSPAWRNQLSAVAADIRAAGLRAGLWTAPFLVAEGCAVAARHPDWLLRDGRGPVRAMHHPRLWGGWALALDPTHPGVLAHLHRTFTVLQEQGFDVHKLDFLYAGALPGRHHDTGVTRAQAFRAGLATIRQALGDGAFVVACGSPLAPAAGLVDAMRVSPDTTVDWLPRPHAPGFHHAAPAAANAARASRLRGPLHRRLWINDADCLLLRHPTDTRTPDQRRILMDIAAASAPYVTVSDDLADYRPDDWALIEKLRSADDAPGTVDDPLLGAVAS